MLRNVRVHGRLPNVTEQVVSFGLSLELCSEQVSDFRADELDVITRQRLIGRQSKDARAQMLSDRKLAAAHA
jgi:hypothetical protein